MHAQISFFFYANIFCTDFITGDIIVKIALSILKVTSKNKHSWTEGGQTSKQVQ